MFVGNFPPDVGYAWTTIAAVYHAVGRRLAERSGVRTVFCFPSGPPGGDRVVFDYASTARSLSATVRFLGLLRREQVRVLYLTDLETWSWRYPLFRLAGVRRIVLHDRTSGDRAHRVPGASVLKRVLHRMPGFSVDLAIGISQYVVERLRTINGVAAERTRLVYNGIELSRFEHAERGALHELLQLPRATRVVFVSGRAQPYKGIPEVIAAAAALERRGARDLAFVYCGDGPALPEFRRLAVEQGVRNFHFLGRRSDVPRLLGSATVAVAPSVWAEAFGLTVVEAMAAGAPVVATAVGGVPEIIRDGVTGVLVPPGNADALASAIAGLLDDAPRRERLAAAARGDVAERFTLQRVVDDLTAVLAPLVAD